MQKSKLSSSGMSINNMITRRQITEHLTVVEYAQWLRYKPTIPIKAYSVLANGEMAWDDYEFHRFYTNMMLGEVNEDTSKRWSHSEGSEPVATGNAPEGHGGGAGDGVHSYDHVPKRREAHEYELPLPEPSCGPQNSGLVSGGAEGVPAKVEGVSGV